MQIQLSAQYMAQPYTKPPRDFQRSKVYSWERAVFGRPTEKMTIDQCVEFAEKICGFKVEVKDGRGRRKACAYRNSRTISLPRWARCEWVVIHECSHLLTPNEFASHGAEYMGIYIEMLEKHGPASGFPYGLAESAKRFGLRVLK